MGLTVNRQIVKKVTVNRQKWIILSVDRQSNQAYLAVKRLKSLLSRTIIIASKMVLNPRSGNIFPNKLK